MEAESLPATRARLVTPEDGSVPSSLRAAASQLEGHMASNDAELTARERRRLQRLSASLHAFETRLWALHDPKSNFASVLSRTLRSHVEPEYQRKSAAIRVTIERADLGCEISEQWLLKTSHLRSEIERLMDEPLQRPVGVPMPPSAWKLRQAGRPRRRRAIKINPMTREQVTAMVMEREVRKAPRDKALGICT